MSDRIELIGLRATGHHGVFDHEREEGQEFVVDVILELDIHRAVSRDDVAFTVHYGELATSIVGVIEGDPVNLIETLAQRIADVALTYALVDAVEVTVHKPHAPIPAEFADVRVRIRRDREPR